MINSSSLKLPGFFAHSLSTKICLDSCCVNKVRDQAALSPAFWNSASWQKSQRGDKQQEYVPHCPSHFGALYRHLSAHMSGSRTRPLSKAVGLLNCVSGKPQPLLWPEKVPGGPCLTVIALGHGGSWFPIPALPPQPSWLWEHSPPLA